MSGVGLGVPALKCSAVALSTASPRSFLAVGFPLQSLTRSLRSLEAIVVGAALFLVGCTSTLEEDKSTSEAYTCQELPATFRSYSEALHQVRKASYPLAETQNTSKSSWVRGVEFYSCDGTSGFFILRTADEEYIHAVPATLWRGFKEASSYGSYYTTNIKRRYHLRLN